MKKQQQKVPSGSKSILDTVKYLPV